MDVLFKHFMVIPFLSWPEKIEHKEDNAIEQNNEQRYEL